MAMYTLYGLVGQDCDRCIGEIVVDVDNNGALRDIWGEAYTLRRTGPLVGWRTLDCAVAYELCHPAGSVVTVPQRTLDSIGADLNNNTICKEG